MAQSAPKPTAPDIDPADPTALQTLRIPLPMLAACGCGSGCGCGCQSGGACQCGGKH
jgi:hypothetical protein